MKQQVGVSDPETCVCIISEAEKSSAVRIQLDVQFPKKCSFHALDCKLLSIRKKCR